MLAVMPVFTEPLRVLVAGGGVAGVEALLALRDLAGDRVELTLLTPEQDFIYRPMAVAAPFARGRARRHALDEVTRDLGVTLVQGRLCAVDAAQRAARTEDGDELSYDALLVGVGARSEPALSVPSTWTPESDADVFGGLLRDLEEGYSKQVAFIVPPGASWPLPAYELAMMTAWDARDMGRDDVEVTVYTPEAAPLEMFGAGASAALREDLDEAGVRVQTGTYVTEEGRSLVLNPGHRRLEAHGRSRCRSRRARTSRDSPPMRAGSCSATATAGSRELTRCGAPATRSRSPSSRAVSRRRKPTPRLSPSLPWRAPTCNHARSSRCCAASCSPIADGPGSAGI
jgi:pyridine nucleotide-disulfide oxidoreductase